MRQDCPSNGATGRYDETVRSTAQLARTAVRSSLACSPAIVGSSRQRVLQGARGQAERTMGLFKRKQKGSARAAPEHAVIIRYSLSDEQRGTAEEREAIFALEDRLIARIDSQKLGEHDGNEFGGGEAAIYCYGPDAGRLFAGIESEVRAFPARPAHA